VLRMASKKRPSVGYLLDVEGKNALGLSGAPILAEWVHSGFAMLHGFEGPCSSLHGASWTFLPDDGAVTTWPAKLNSMPSSRIAAVPGRAEFVMPCTFGDLPDEERLARVAATDGQVLAKEPARNPTKPDDITIAHITAAIHVAGYIVDTCWSPRAECYELRRLDDLSLIATTTAPGGFPGIPDVTAAEHAPRLLFWFEDKFAVYNFVAPTPAKK